MFYYAQLDVDNICIGVSQLSGEVNEPNMILLESYDTSLIGKKYNDGTWEDMPTPEPTPTPQDVFNAAFLSKLNELTVLIKGVS